MKNIILAALAVCSFSSAPAFADPALFNWTGFYAGADVGELSGEGRQTTTTGQFSAPTSSAATYGGHAGYRYQFAPNWVAGIEGQVWRAEQYEALSQYTLTTNNGKIVIRDGYTALGTLGFTIDPQVLIYGAGGFSSLNHDGCVTTTGTSTCGGAGASFSGDRSAFTWGGGVAILMTPNLILSFQYLHADYGAKTYLTPPVVGGSIREELKTDTVTAGLSWKFGN